MNLRLICLPAMVWIGGCAAAHHTTAPIDRLQLPYQIRWPHLQGRNFQSRARVTLEDAGGQRITLDALLLARLPEQVRARCWKFDRLVMEWGIDQGKNWVWRSEDHPTAGNSVGAFSELGRLIPEIRQIADHPEHWRFIEQSEVGRWRYQYVNSSSLRWVMEIDGEAKTLTAIVATNAANHASYRLAFESYQEWQGELIPHRITAQGPGGGITARILELTLDQTPAVGAFDPPSGAQFMPEVP